MNFRLILVAVFFLGAPHSVALSQDCNAHLQGGWYTQLPVQALFELVFRIHQIGPNTYRAHIESGPVEEETTVWQEGGYVRLHATKFPVSFKGKFTVDKKELNGFVYYGASATRVTLQADFEEGPWNLKWSPLKVFEETAVYELYINDEGSGQYGGYFFFQDQRMPSLYGYGFQCTGSRFEVGEKNLGLLFKGHLDEQDDVLRLSVSGGMNPADLTFSRIPEDYSPPLRVRPRSEEQYRAEAPPQEEDGWTTASPEDVGMNPENLAEMVKAVVEENLALTHSILIAREGKLVVEEYFYGYTMDTPHDMRSASKSLTSTFIGLAIQENQIPGVDAAALSFFPDYRFYDNWDLRKTHITIEHLMTMSSGLDADDSRGPSAAAEHAYQSQTSQPDWVKFALDAPMIDNPGSQPLYGSANPSILGGVLQQALDEPVEWFADRTLFEPLGIHTYTFALSPAGRVYMGGGLYLKPRDMLKYGQLYLDGGLWNGHRILTQAWVDASLAQYGRLAPLDYNGNFYGYLWWHHEYTVGEEVIHTIEARGNGGQYIFVIPSLEMTVVITSGNYRTGRTRQPQEILGKYILPAVLPEQ